MSTIDINFLKPNVILKSNEMDSLKGIEYLDWQTDTNFYKSLVTYFESVYNKDTSVFNFDQDSRNRLIKIIYDYSNIKVAVKPTTDLNIGIDAGYILPGNILNIKNIDKFYNKNHTKIAEAFKDLKKDILNGWCDVKTGKLEGDYKKIEWSLYLSVDVTSWIDKPFMKSGGVTLPECYAAFVLHELGHVFGGLLFISKKTIDNMLLVQAIRMYNNVSESSSKVTIIKDLLKETECETPKIDLDKLTDEEIVILFNKQCRNRDYRRTLSLGVTEMSSEVLADAYAIRMGAGKALAVSIGSINVKTTATNLWSILMIYMGYLLSVLSGFFFSAFVFSCFFYLSIWSFLKSQLVPQLGYDTDYRRSVNVLREMSSNLINNKRLSDSVRKELIEEAKSLDEVTEMIKPFWESTSVQRFMGWVSNGSDFRKTDFEHYTANLASTRLELYKDIFSK